MMRSYMYYHPYYFSFQPLKIAIWAKQQNSASLPIGRNQGTILAAFQESTSASNARHRLTETMPEIEQQMRFATFRQYSALLVGLKKAEQVKTVKQKLEQAKQELNKQQELNKTLNNTIEQLNTINNNAEPILDKQSVNIAGWSIQKSGGFYRAFRRIGGKMQGIYLGKSLDGAEQKIRLKNNHLNAQDTNL